MHVTMFLICKIINTKMTKKLSQNEKNSYFGVLK